MTAERTINTDLHLIVESPDKNRQEVILSTKKIASDKYGQFLLDAEEKMRNQLNHGIYVDKTTSHGRRKSLAEIRNERLSIASDFRQAISVIEGSTSKSIRIYTDKNGEPYGFSVEDEFQSGRKIES